jgi:carboxyl-terminal processing protease
LQLDDLIKTAKAESYYEPFKSSFEKLKTDLSNNKEKDLETFKTQIIKLLEQEIVTRYYYKKGSIENMIHKDDAVIEALNILGEPSAYNAILEGNSSKGKIKKKALSE